MSVQHPETTSHKAPDPATAAKPAAGTAGPQEEAAAEAKAKPAATPKAAPEPAAAPPPTYKDANGADVSVGDLVNVPAVVMSVSADDANHGGNVALKTVHSLTATSDEKDMFNVRTAVVEGQGPAPGTKKADDKAGAADTPTTPPPTHTAAKPHAQPGH